MDEIAIKVENLRIRYKSLGSYSIKKNFLKLKKNKRETFEAVRGISFEVPKGQILGIIGKNGSGKSTLLRALAGIFSPDEGTIETYGNSFAGLGKFIDMPVRTYSSGMYSKLAFSITAILETDIMLIDEVLSVGDQRFKKKSLRKMKSLIADEDRTVVIVSHSIGTLRRLCEKVMWMEDGKIMMFGDADEVLDKYEAYMDSES